MTYPKISEVITSLIELQEIIGDQHITLAQYSESEEAEVPLPDIPGLGVIIHGHNGEVTRE